MDISNHKHSSVIINNLYKVQRFLQKVSQEKLMEGCFESAECTAKIKRAAN